MPIYAYKCTHCGHEQEVLQKISDPPLADCPDCGQPSMTKQVTAAGFQLKGSGWYATDFRNNGAGKATGTKTDTASTDGANDSKSDGAGTEPKPAAATTPTSAAPACGSGGCATCT